MDGTRFAGAIFGITIALAELHYALAEEAEALVSVSWFALAVVVVVVVVVVVGRCLAACCVLDVLQTHLTWPLQHVLVSLGMRAGQICLFFFARTFLKPSTRSHGSHWS